MGHGASASIVFGICLDPYDKDYKPHPLYKEDEDEYGTTIGFDYLEENDLRLERASHAEYYGDEFGSVLTHKDFPTVDVYEVGTEKLPTDMEIDVFSDSMTTFAQEIEKHGLDMTDAGWYLVVSYG